MVFSNRQYVVECLYKLDVSKSYKTLSYLNTSINFTHTHT